MLLSSNYFPNLEYMSLALSADRTVIDQHEHFIKQSYRTRCQISGPNGVQNLIVPVYRKNHLPMKDVKINYSENWIKQHLKSLKTAYASSPFFEDYLPYFEAILQTKPTFLVDLNQSLFNSVLANLGSTISVEMSEEFMPYSDQDLRLSIHPKRSSSFSHSEYYQCFDEKHGHLPNLSILDLLFNEGPNSISFL